MATIHMNGRIYDAKLGRFLQADPIFQAPKNSQNLNRYSYVINNPLSYTDPSGFSFFKKWGRMIVAAVAGYFTFVAASGWAASWLTGTALAGNAAAIGAIAGAISGFVGGAILTGTLKGAFYGALSGAALGAISGTAGLNDAEKVVSSGASGGVISELQGGKFGHGFLSAGVGFWSGLKFGGSPSVSKFLGTALVGGTVSRLTGGKFENGAFSAALAYLIGQVSTPSDSSNLGRAETSSTNNNPIDASKVAEFEQVIEKLVADGTLSSSRVFESADSAAQEVLSITAPLSRKFELEVGGSIVPSSRGNGFHYSIPIVGTKFNVTAHLGAIGYHTHTGGPLRFSNNLFNSGAGNDAAWVKSSGHSLYLGVYSGNSVGIGVCSPGNCSLVGFRGTSPSRVLQ